MEANDFSPYRPACVAQRKLLRAAHRDARWVSVAAVVLLAPLFIWVPSISPTSTGVVAALIGLIWLRVGLMSYRMEKGWYGNNAWEARELLKHPCGCQGTERPAATEGLWPRK